MSRSRLAAEQDRKSIIGWAARMGAVTAEAVAVREELAVASARSRLSAAAREGLLSRCRPLAGKASLYAITSSGLRFTGLRGLGPCRVSASNAAHLMACAQVAAMLERRYPDHRVLGERELREIEGHDGAVSAGVLVRGGRAGLALRHRPDLVLWPADDECQPVAVEVELTVKAPDRLAGICRSWARSRHVAGVLYLVPASVEAAVKRAIAAVDAEDRVLVAHLDALLGSSPGDGASERTVAVEP
jgi:hypothetical protein